MLSAFPSRLTNSGNLFQSLQTGD